jgi:hypothetical protein
MALSAVVLNNLRLRVIYSAVRLFEFWGRDHVILKRFLRDEGMLMLFVEAGLMRATGRQRLNCATAGRANRQGIIAFNCGMLTLSKLGRGSTLLMRDIVNNHGLRLLLIVHWSLGIVVVYLRLLLLRDLLLLLLLWIRGSRLLRRRRDNSKVRKHTAEVDFEFGRGLNPEAPVNERLELNLEEVEFLKGDTAHS